MQQERTEEPTPRRRERARSEGQAPRSFYLPVAFSFAVALILVPPLVSFSARWLLGFASLAEAAAQVPLSVEPAHEMLRMMQYGPTIQAWRFVLLAWLVAAASATCSAALSGSAMLAPTSVVPRWRRLSWSSGLRRIVSVENTVNAALGTVCVALIVVLTLPLYFAALPRLVSHGEFQAQASVAFGLVQAQWWRITSLLLLCGCLDVLVQGRRHRARLRMTPRELRDDRAESETRPEIKQHRRALAAKRGRGLRLAAIKRASAVVANPTHVAVALRYAPPQLDVPVVVARGAERLAATIRDAAARHDVPVFESPDLAQRLYAHVDVDEPIPEEYYAAVAAVFAWIIKTSGQLRDTTEGDEA